MLKFRHELFKLPTAAGVTLWESVSLWKGQPFQKTIIPKEMALGSKRDVFCARDGKEND